MNIFVKCFLICVSLFFITSCSTNPAVCAIETPTSSLEMAVEDAMSDPLFEPVCEVPKDWWSMFEDPQLDTFIEEALEQNPNLQIAETNVLLAATTANRLRASLFPYLYWGADVSREKLSETGIVPFNSKEQTLGMAPLIGQGGSNGIPVYFTQYETELNLTYDFDLWGKNRNTWKAALSEVQADLADAAFTRLELAIAVAKVYFQLQIDYRRKHIAEEMLQARLDYLNFVNMRAKNNLENRITVNNAETNVASAEEDLVKIEGNIAVSDAEFKAYLGGRFEEVIREESISEKPLPKVPFPCNLPVNLLSKRPDITAQLWLIESAGRQIEVAKAGFYPDFNLTAFFGFQTLHLQELFKWPSSFYNIDPAVTLPIFDGGRLIANLQGSEINYDLAILRYNELVLNAAKEVFQALAVLRSASQQLEQARKKAEYIGDNFRLTTLRMQHNLNSRLDYIVNKENYLVAQDEELQALKNTYQAILSLIKAVGGGYDANIGS